MMGTRRQARSGRTCAGLPGARGRLGRPGRAFTLPELVVILVVAAVAVAIVLPVLAQAAWQTRRTACAQSLAEVTRALGQYAEAYGGAFPTRGFGPRTKRFDVIGVRLSQPLANANNNTRSLFLVLRLRFATPEMLICPNTEDQPASLASGDAPYYDFNVGNGSNYANRLSYSYHLQFRDRSRLVRGYPLSRESHGLMALLADRTPLLTYPGQPAGEGVLAEACGVPTGLTAAEANSYNHEQRGQNVAYVAGHVAWATAPTVGPDGDNIFTVWLGPDRASGTIAFHATPQGPTDCFLVP